MNVTKDDLSSLEKRIDLSIERIEKKVDEPLTLFAQSMDGLTKELGMQTVQIERLVTTLEHHEKSKAKLEGKIDHHDKEIEHIKIQQGIIVAKQGGFLEFMKGIGFPLIVAACLIFFGIKK